MIIERHMERSNGKNLKDLASQSNPTSLLGFDYQSVPKRSS